MELCIFTETTIFVAKFKIMQCDRTTNFQKNKIKFKKTERKQE